MFIQVIVGRVKDVAAMKAAHDRWLAELRTGAEGFLGFTAGQADDGTYVEVVRFSSEEAAKANSDRPEQDTFWKNEVAPLFDGEPTFYNCPEVTVLGRGGSDEAGFVQVMVSKPKDLAPLRELNKVFDKFLDQRPDLIGATSSVATDGTVIDTNYFTSEDAAREGEKKELPADVQAMMQGFEENAGPVTFIDLRDPWLA